jgi:uncharacterized membrane protein
VHVISERSVEINAPATTVWEIFADVVHWPDWTASIQRIVPLDQPQITVGTRFAIKQPRLPNLVWEVTAVEPGRSWTWRQRSLGTATLACHEVVALASARTLVQQRIEPRGPIGVTTGVLMARLTKRYLTLEAHGLKTHAEQISGATAT